MRFKSSFHFFDDASRRSPEESWMEFQAQYPTRHSCLEELYDRMGLNWTKECPRCHSKQVEHRNDYRSLKCLICHKESWFTAGTFLARIREPRAWLGAIWLIERRVLVNSFTLHKLAGISYSSALLIFKKLMFLIDSQLKDPVQSVPSKQFSSLFLKRSRETPARAHPLAEEDDRNRQLESRHDASPDHYSCTNNNSDLESSSVNNESSHVGASSSLRNNRETLVLKTLSSHPLHIDTLAERTGMPIGELSGILIMLELSGFATRLAGERYTTPPAQMQPAQLNSQTQESIANAIAYVRSVFKGISRKYLQDYIALYCYYRDFRTCPAGMLLQLCSKRAYIAARDLFSRVCPLNVRFRDSISDHRLSTQAANSS